MGEVIRRSAAAEDIVADGQSAYTKAQARGGKWQELSEQSLGPPLKLSAMVGKRYDAAKSKAAPLIAAQSSENGQADNLIGRTADSVWNDLDRPAKDALYDLMFPGGIMFYTDGDDDEQPARMELLAELLESNLHPKLDPKQVKLYATELRASAASLESAVDAARKPRAQLQMYDRMKTAAARNVQMGLVNFKRALKIAGMSEAEIHSVIPDRPAPKREPAAPPPAPPAP